MSEYHVIIDGKPVYVRICRVYAFSDPQWLEQNGLPPRRRFMGRNAKKDRAAIPSKSSSAGAGDDD